MPALLCRSRYSLARPGPGCPGGVRGPCPHSRCLPCLRSRCLPCPMFAVPAFPAFAVPGVGRARIPGVDRARTPGVGRARCWPCPLRAGPAEPRFPRRSRCAPRSTQEMEAAPRKRLPSLPAGIDPAWNPPGVSAAEGCAAGNWSSVGLLEFVRVLLFIYFSFLRTSCSPGSLVFLPVGCGCAIPSCPYPKEFTGTASYLLLHKQILLLLAEGQRSSAGRTNLRASP